jgi:hypothetical protein
MAADSHWFTLQPSVARATLLGDSAGMFPSRPCLSRLLLIVLTVPILRGDRSMPAAGGENDLNSRFGTFLELCNLDWEMCFVKAQ